MAVREFGVHQLDSGGNDPRRLLRTGLVAQQYREDHREGGGPGREQADPALPLQADPQGVQALQFVESDPGYLVHPVVGVAGVRQRVRALGQVPHCGRCRNQVPRRQVQPARKVGEEPGAGTHPPPIPGGPGPALRREVPQAEVRKDLLRGHRPPALRPLPDPPPQNRQRNHPLKGGGPLVRAVRPTLQEAQEAARKVVRSLLRKVCQTRR